MIAVNFNKPEFEYDVHSLMKAFFPKEDVEMYYTCAEAETEGKNVACTHREVGSDAQIEERPADTSQVFFIDYIDSRNPNAFPKESYDCISIRWESKRSVASVQEDSTIVKETFHTRFLVDGTNRKETKNALKQQLYNLLKKGLKKELPWGTLTGIRPTKIPMKLMEEGYSDKEIVSYMKEAYFAADEKIQLSIDIAKRERALLSKIDYENGYSLYIGIPFCPSTCLYCSFTSYPLAVWSKQVDAYLEALEKEMHFTAVKFRHKKLNSIYIGGGTPTTLNPQQLDRLIRKIKCSFDLQHCVEFTVEAGRPDSITREKLAVLRKHGIDRISINPQTMKQETLDLIGRRHTVEEITESFKMARELGFNNINMDLIMGLPQESLEDVRNTMEELKALGPDNITIHSLAIKRAARLNIFKDHYKDMQMVNTQEHMDLCAKYCKEMGLFPYYLYRQKGMAGNMENVGYAKSGKAGVYNILIMEEKQTIVALGAGASTKKVYPDGVIERCENVKDVGHYIARIDEMIDRKRKFFEGFHCGK
uniref:coproporphyrinogen dehydrogenase HemZ n=1 Tax=Agathobacter sp. TaxID=2021311 RepID=UPI004056C42E